MAGEGVTHLDEGRPMVVRKPESKFTLANFCLLYTSQIDFRLSARLNRVMTGESLRQTDTNFESEENTMKKIQMCIRDSC